MDGWVEGWMCGLKAVLRIAYNDQKQLRTGRIRMKEKRERKIERKIREEEKCIGALRTV